MVCVVVGSCDRVDVHIALLGVAIGGHARRKTKCFRPLRQTSHHLGGLQLFKSL